MDNITGRLGNRMFTYAFLKSLHKRGLVPDLYLQSEEYFENCKDEIRELYSTGIGYSNYVSIHVRRGDYVGNKFYFDLFSEGYYERAMFLFPGEKFIVFSDDVEWCKTQEIFKDCAFSEGNSEVEDMNLMASCKSNIIANSSFSWWAAWLNPNPAKEVVAPKNWFTDLVPRVTLPASWILV